MAKINTHKLLSDYHGREDYPEIARFAASLLPEIPRGLILSKVREKYGIVEKTEYKTDPAPLTIFGEVGTLIPENAVEQMENALRLPPAVKGVLLPDAHHGYSVPIGGVVVLENAVSPAFIGFDISCMMHMNVLNIEPEDLLDDKEFFLNALKKTTSFGVGAAFDEPKDHFAMDLDTWNATPVIKNLKANARNQLGSSGGGNHFADLMVGTWLDTGEEFVALVTHSGSRGTGHKIATHYTKAADEYAKRKAHNVPKGYGWLDMDTDLGQEYFTMMELMGFYAQANHAVIHRDFMEEAGVYSIFELWNKHNFAWETKDNMFVHRKGATPAHKGELGIIPGTSGTYSYIVRGLGNPDSVFSSSHGAGRPHSRKQAKAQHNQVKFAEHMNESGILYSGLASDETYQAYKNIEDVMAVQDGVLLERVARLEPKIVLMGGKSDDGD